MYWKIVNLSELCSIITKGTTPSNIGDSFTDKGIKYIRSEMLTSAKYISGDFLHISKETHEKLKRSQLKTGDILFSMAGVYLGKTAILRPEDIPANTNQAVALIRIAPDKADNEFVYYFLNMPDVVKMANTVQSQSAQPNINLKQIGLLKIKMPDLDTQNRIANILSAYDDLIENNQKQIKLLEEAAQRLYKEWFVDLHFPNYENTPIVDGVPEGWSRKKLLDIAVFLRRGISPTYSTDGKYYVINQKCIRTSIMDFSEARKQEKNYGAEFNIQDADTVICSTGTGTLGRVGQVFGNYDNTTFDSHVTLVRSDVYPNYIYHAIKDRQPYLMNMGKGSTNQQELSKEVIGTLQILIPDKVTMIYFEKSASNIHQEILTLVKKIIGLKKSRDILLPKLMSGELEV